MALQKQIHIYSVDTSAFYKKRERKIHKKLNVLYSFKNEIQDRIVNTKDEKLKEKLNKCYKTVDSRIKYYKYKLYKTLSANKSIRNLYPDALNTKNIVSIFESTLTRILQIPENTLNTDIIIVQAFYFDIIKDIISNGFMLENEKYVCFTASAGQIRAKKTVFIKENVLFKYQNTLMCGLTIDNINSLGGININKYLAYLALCSSATDLWKDFDITKSIVVDDLETAVRGIVDYIDDKTYAIKRQEMDVPITHTDGCGMILPSKSKKNFMVRLPWIKGLLVSFPFDIFIQEANKKSTGAYYGIVTDIFGQKHDILKDGIEIIFTKSQFKMYKYYTSWNQYMDSFTRYQCQAGKCNEEEYYFEDAKTNYQMLQTLTDMEDHELKAISKATINHIMKIGNDKKTMLKVFGVTKSNANKTNLQQALEIYPELLCDVYTKEVLRQIKKSLVKEGRSGKLEISGAYTFICPDLYAFCEYLFLNNRDPDGLLKGNEVYCALYKDTKRLDCLRSPHLFREHAVRNNVIDNEKSMWFTTNGLYTSCHDLISKVLQFDNDGDKSLVCSDPVIVSVAERNMKGVVPLYYNMRKADAEIINNGSIYDGLKLAYTGGNIGIISNNITKIWNISDVYANEEALEVIKLLCMESNFTIDYAKTLYKPKRPSDKVKTITQYTKCKTPHFFIYAKDKTKEQVEKINNSVVNRLTKIVPNPRINFNSAMLGKFDYKMLMRDSKVELNEAIINLYKQLDQKHYFLISSEEDGKYSNVSYLYNDIRAQLLKLDPDVYYVTDVLIKYLYEIKSSRFKDTLWMSFGDIIVENLNFNIKIKHAYCKKCGILIEHSNNKIKYCKNCAKEINIQKTIENRKNRCCLK